MQLDYFFAMFDAAEIGNATEIDGSESLINNPSEHNSAKNSGLFFTLNPGNLLLLHLRC
jgi:hypothetical protein